MCALANGPLMLFLFSKSNCRLRQISLLNVPVGMQLGEQTYRYITRILNPEVAERPSCTTHNSLAAMADTLLQRFPMRGCAGVVESRVQLQLRCSRRGKLLCAPRCYGHYPTEARESSG